MREEGPVGRQRSQYGPGGEQEEGSGPAAEPDNPPKSDAPAESSPSRSAAPSPEPRAVKPHPSVVVPPKAAPVGRATVRPPVATPADVIRPATGRTRGVAAVRPNPNPPAAAAPPVADDATGGPPSSNRAPAGPARPPTAPRVDAPPPAASPPVPVSTPPNPVSPPAAPARPPRTPFRARATVSPPAVRGVARPVGSVSARPPAGATRPGTAIPQLALPPGTPLTLPAAAPRPDGPPASTPDPSKPPGAAPPGAARTPAERPGPPGARGLKATLGRRGLLVGLLSTVLVLVLATVGLVVVRPGPVAGWLGSSDPTRPSPVPGPSEPAPSPVLAGAAVDAPVPTAGGVRAAIDTLVHDAGLGTRVSASVVDGTTGRTLYASGANVPTTPASITKLITAATVLEARGPAYRIGTRVVAGLRPGEVVLIGGGDPTLAVNGTGTYPGAARLDRLAARVKTALGGVTPTRVIVDTSLYSGPLYGPGWDPDIVTGGFAAPMTALMTDGGRIDPKDTSDADRYAQPDLAAGRAFARVLGMPQNAVAATARGRAPTGGATASATPTGGVPAPGTELGVVESPPMIRLVELMLSESDNVLAEALARQVALAKKEPASYAGGAAAMDAELADLGLDPDQAQLSDGSGLSRRNRITPTLLTDLLSLAASGHERVAGLFGGLPVAGWSGTLKDRFRTPADGSRSGAGAVRAKTGTLNRVNGIAGIVQTAEGRLLAFAVLADQVPSATLDAQAALDRIAATLATCGCR